MIGSFFGWGTVSVGLAGLAIVALGAWVYVLRPRDERHRAFSLYLFLYGASDVVLAIPFLAPHDRNALDMAWTFAILGAGWALVWFMLVYPRPRLPPRRQRMVLVALGGGLVAFATLLLSLHDTGNLVQADGTTAYTFLYPVTAAAWLLPIALAPFVFSLDLLRSEDDRERSALRLVVVAGALWPLYDLTHTVIAIAASEGMADPGSEWFLGGRLTRIGIELLVLAAAVNLLRQANRQRTPWFPLAAALAIGPAVQLLRRAVGLEDAIGVVDLVLPVVVTIAILRGGLFGLDVKLRFAISRSTLAAIFIAIFFVASEAAQQFFGETLGSTYLGIAAAGALVFAFTPLQRLADRIAQSAVPTSSPPPSLPASHSLEVYRDLARRLAADGELSVDDRRRLAYVAQEMRLGAGEVHDVMVEVAKGRGR